MTKFSFIVYHTLWEIIDWVYPPNCSGCGSPGSRWCGKCENDTVLLSNDICDVCGYPIIGGGLCTRCDEVRPKYNKARSLCQYQSQIRDALHNLKYNNDLGVGEVFGKKCAEYLSELHWEIDCIVPVPLGKQRRKERGYNQAAMIAYPMALLAGIPYKPSCLLRAKETHTQVEYSSEQRRQNVQGAFRSKKEYVQDKNILIIDDIITTGSTIDECSIALIEAGAKSVYGLSVARTMLAGKLT